MTISRVEIQGQVTRAQDFTTIKHNEDNKGMVDQSNFQRQFDQSVENKVRLVHQGDRRVNQGKKYDAMEKGYGSYAGDGGRKRKKNQEDGKVVLKNKGGFDMKI